MIVLAGHAYIYIFIKYFMYIFIKCDINFALKSKCTFTFLEMTAKALESETAQARKDVLRLKGEYYATRDQLEWLAKEYEASKKHNPTQRYTDLKDMVKRVTKGEASSRKN